MLAADRPEAALDHAEQAVETVDEATNRLGAVRATTTLGRCRGAVGDDDAARDHLETALSEARDLGLRTQACRIHYHLGCVARDRGDTAASRSQFQEALDVADAIGATRLERQCESSLGSL